ncbi:MAG: hypothetical protein FWD18_06895, partial [Micrococcales bacterium]|nr:hypothetical protein [Micrococcales bacterium]
SNIWLFRPTSQPRPEGFEYSRQLGWVRKFHISEVEHRFSVTTTAVWQGQRVEVDYIREDGRVLVRGDRRWSGSSLHPAVTVTEKGFEWEALVPQYELTEVVETYRDSVWPRGSQGRPPLDDW